MKNFEKVAQAVWANKSIDVKRTLLLDTIEDFDHKGKFGQNVMKFQIAVNKANSVELDFIASNLALNKDLKVIKYYVWLS